MSPVLSSFGGGSARGFGRIRAGLIGPTSLSATPQPNTSVLLTWTNTSSNQVRIYRSITATPTTLVTTVTAGTTSHTVTGLTGNTTHYFWVRHFNGVIESVDGGNSTSALTTPNAPLNVSVYPGSQANTIYYTINNNGGGGNGDVRIYRNNVLLTTLPNQYGYSNFGTSFNDTSGYTANALNTYEVRTFNASGESSPGVVTANNATPATNLTQYATATANTLYISWTNGNTSMPIQVIANGAVITTLSANTTSYAIAGLSAGTGYTISIRYVSSGAESVSLNGTLYTAPAAPTLSTSYTAYEFYQGVNITWTAVDELYDTNIYRDGSLWTTVYGSEGSGLSKSIDVSVTGYNSQATITLKHVANSVLSAASNAVVVYTVPNTPSSLYSTASTTTSITLSWTNAHSTNVVTEIYRNNAYIGEVAAGTTSYVNTGLSAGTSYSYKVRHRGTLSGFYSGNFSNTISASTSVAYGSQTYTTAGSYTFTVPTGVTSLRITLVGGGGGGSGGSSGFAGNGGGGGGSITNIILSVSPGNNLTVAVGSGGAAGAAANNNSAAGGNTLVTFGVNSLQANGGTRGLFQANSAFAAAPGGGTSTPIGTGGTTTTGGTGQVGSVASKGGNGGSSTLASGGAGATFTLTGGAGSQGSGGGGGYGSYQLAQASNGGIGGTGYVKIEYGF